MADDPGLQGRQAAAFPVNLLTRRAFGAVRPFSRLSEDELKVGLSSIESELRPVTQRAIRLLEADPVAGSPGQFDITVPLISTTGSTGVGLVVRVAR